MIFFPTFIGVGHKQNKKKVTLTKSCEQSDVLLQLERDFLLHGSHKKNGSWLPA